MKEDIRNAKRLARRLTHTSAICKEFQVLQKEKLTSISLGKGWRNVLKLFIVNLNLIRCILESYYRLLSNKGKDDSLKSYSCLLQSR